MPNKLNLTWFENSELRQHFTQYNIKKVYNDSVICARTYTSGILAYTYLLNILSSLCFSTFRPFPPLSLWSFSSFLRYPSQISPTYSLDWNFIQAYSCLIVC